MEKKQETRLTRTSLAAYTAVAIVATLGLAMKGSDACGPEGSHWLDENNRSLECVNGAFRPAKPSVVGQSCLKGDSSRDACGQALYCDDAVTWAMTLGNRVCTR